MFTLLENQTSNVCFRKQKKQSRTELRTISIEQNIIYVILPSILGQIQVICIFYMPTKIDMSWILSP